MKNNIGIIVLPLILLSLAQPIQAANLTTTINQASQWDNWSLPIWQTNGTGSLVGTPVADNSYALVANGTVYGTNAGFTRVRTMTNGNPVIFGGGSLTINTNTSLVGKAAGPTTYTFPGANGNPGLILNGGVVINGNDYVLSLGGNIQILSQSYLLCDGVASLRSWNIDGQLSGSGNMVLFSGYTNLPIQITCLGNSFSGQWIVKGGWLYGANYSLGTNNITMDTNYNLGFTTSASPGNAVLEIAYDINSAGTLTLANGSMMRLHQDCFFTAVNIRGAFLSAGQHPYSELRSLYPSTFPDGGSGSITVQPYNNAPMVSQNFHVGIVLQGTPQSSYDIQYSTNLTQPTTWFTATNITITNVIQEWIEPQPTRDTSRFYRAVLTY